MAGRDFSGPSQAQAKIKVFLVGQAVLGLGSVFFQAWPEKYLSLVLSNIMDHLYLVSRDLVLPSTSDPAHLEKIKKYLQVKKIVQKNHGYSQ